MHPLTPRRVLQGLIVLVLALISASGVLYHFLEIDVINYLPARSFCPFRALTGLPCPGCGMTRAMLSLGQIKPAGAAAFNPLSIPLFLAMLLYLFVKRTPSWLGHKWIGGLMIALVLAVWVLRLGWI